MNDFIEQHFAILLMAGTLVMIVAVVGILCAPASEGAPDCRWDR